MADARPPFFYSSFSTVGNILTSDEKEAERQRQQQSGPGSEETGEVRELLPYEEWAESNLLCWGRSQDGQAGKQGGRKRGRGGWVGRGRVGSCFD